jgi:beta-N-acetylhexosaminidase
VALAAGIIVGVVQKGGSGGAATTTPLAGGSRFASAPVAAATQASPHRLAVPRGVGALFLLPRATIPGALVGARRIDADIGGVVGPEAGKVFNLGQAIATLRADRVRRIIAIPGSFPGQGAASRDPAQGVATVGLTLAELEARDMRPFFALAPLAPAIQMSNAVYNAFDGVTPATLLPQAVALLREHYAGVIVSGNLEAATLATGSSVGAAAIAALEAGCDMLDIPGPAADARAAYRAVIGAIGSGVLDPTEIKRSLARVRRLKL